MENVKTMCRLGLALLFCVCFASCSDDFDDEDILGTWQFYNAVYSNNDANAPEPFGVVETKQAQALYFWQFGEDHKGYQYDQGGHMQDSFTWRISKGNLQMNFSREWDFREYHITNLKGKEMTLSFSTPYQSVFYYYKRVYGPDDRPEYSSPKVSAEE